MRLIESAHSQRSKASTASHPPYVVLSMLQKSVLSHFPVLPPVRLSYAGYGHKHGRRVPVTVRNAGDTPVVAPTLIDPTTVQRLRSVTSTVVGSQISKNNYYHELHLRLAARIRAPVPLAWSAPSVRPISEQPRYLTSP